MDGLGLGKTALNPCVIQERVHREEESAFFPGQN